MVKSVDKTSHMVLVTMSDGAKHEFPPDISGCDLIVRLAARLRRGQ